MSEPDISIHLNADWENMSDETKEALAEMIWLAAKHAEEIIMNHRLANYLLSFSGEPLERQGDE